MKPDDAAMTNAPYSGRQFAQIVLSVTGPVGYIKLHSLMYLANLESLRDEGHLMTAAPFFVAWHGPECRDVSERWYASHMARASRKLSLVRRMRRWLIQESKRKGWLKRMGKINMPGGWGILDAAAWYAGSMRASWVLPIDVRMFVEGLAIESGGET